MKSNKFDQYGPTKAIRIPMEDTVLHGDLRTAKDALGLVIFVHGSGSSRFSPRNRYVAEELNKQGLATLLMDLLTEEEQEVDAKTMQYRFDIPLLSRRSTHVAVWARLEPSLVDLPIGLFGASTGAAAALISAAAMKEDVAAVVSRGGRPDMADEALAQVIAPTLLIVGGEDATVLDLNRKAMAKMRCPTELHVVPRATHLFEEAGTLEEVATVAGNWFVKHLSEYIRHAHPKAAGWN
jgi:dienelactone hydrolase